jgi:hypothetical protein
MKRGLSDQLRRNYCKTEAANLPDVLIKCGAFMNENSYSVILEPDIKDGFDRTSVVKKLAVLFKRKEPLVEKLLAASPKIIRKDLDRVTAEKYVRLIGTAGASARIDPLIVDSTPAEVLQSEPRGQESSAEREISHRSRDQTESDHQERARFTTETPERESRQQISSEKQILAGDNTCPRCGYIAEIEDDVLLVRGDCPRCGLLVNKGLATATESRSEDDSDIDYYEGKIPASWERRFLASIYTFSLFLANYAVITLVFILVFAPLDSVTEQIGTKFLSSAFSAFPIFTTALIVLGLCLAVPFLNGGKSWAQSKFEIDLMYTPEAQVGGLPLSLGFRVATIMMISFLPGMVILWALHAFERLESFWATNLVTVASAALSWAASIVYVKRRPDRRSLLDLAAGTIQIEDTALSDGARMKALAPFAATVAIWIILAGIMPFAVAWYK